MESEGEEGRICISDETK
jgi:hypothetical protein